MNNIVGLALMLTLSACATGYHNAANPLLGMTGGFSHKEGYGSLTKVSFDGNAFTELDTVTAYTLRRSAELASQRKKSHFTIYRSIYEAHFDVPAASPNYYLLGRHASGFVYVRFFDEAREGAFLAADVLSMYKDDAIESNKGKAGLK